MTTASPIDEFSDDLASRNLTPFGDHDRALVVVSPTFAPEPLGTPLYAADAVSWLAGAGWSVDVVTAQPFYPHFERYPGYGRRTRRDRIGGVPVHRLPTVVPRGGRAPWRLAGDANFLAQGVARAFTGLIPRASTVLSISPGAPAATLVGAAVRRPGGRHVSLVHDVQSGLAEGLGMVKNARVVDGMRRFERRSLDVADLVLTLSEEMAAVLRGIGVATPIEVLPLWSTVAAPTATIGPVTDVQFAGNLGRKQALDQLLALMVRLRQIRPQTTFTIRGAGPMQAELEAQLAGAGLDVEVLPPVDDRALPAALAASRVHVVPQLATTGVHVVPSKIVNALAVGGAVVALCAEGSPVTRMAAACEAIRVVPPGAVDEAAVAVCALLEGQDAKRLRAAAIAYAAEHHDRERLLSRLHGILLGAGVRGDLRLST